MVQAGHGFYSDTRGGHIKREVKRQHHFEHFLYSVYLSTLIHGENVIIYVKKH